MASIKSFSTLKTKSFSEYTEKDIISYLNKKKRVIPLNIFQTWQTKELPTYMKINVDLLKKNNPKFKYFLYDDKDCEDFIKNNFNQDVYEAFENLIPGAYKADLWRYCILYTYGGIYLDIKMQSIDNFELINLVYDEHFVLDRKGFWKENCFGVYNAFIVSKPKNPLLFSCIQEIIKNVKNKNYTFSPLYVSGPGMLGELYHNFYSNKNNLDLENKNNLEIVYKKIKIFSHYKEYRLEQKETKNYIGYHKLWQLKKIYKNDETSEENSNQKIIKNSEELIKQKKENFKNLEYSNPKFIKNFEGLINPEEEIKQIFEETSDKVPLNIWQTWKEKNMHIDMFNNINDLRESNPEFKYYIFDDQECLEFIKEHYTEDVANAFVTLVPGAYKADLWRYCVLYIYGGIYLDVKFKCLDGFKLLNLIEDDHYCLDLINNGFHKDEQECIFNGIMINKPKNELLINAIYKIVENVKNKFYGSNWLEITGPNLLGKIFNKTFFKKDEKYIFYGNNSKEIIKKSKIDIFFDDTPPVKFVFLYKGHKILGQYETYRKNLGAVSYISYAKHWENKTVYLGDKIEIPLKIWQTWNTKDLPYHMKKNTEQLISENPEFEYSLFDDEDCANFIKNNFEINIYNLFNNLIPGAFKADLWRYCILYIYGGIYLDIKYKSIGGFKLINLTKQEHYVYDRQDHFEKGYLGIHQSFLVCAKENPLMLRCIKQILINYQKNFYGYSPLEVSGPGLIGRLYHSSYCDKSKIDIINKDSIFLSYKGKEIFTYYKEYRNEQSSVKNYKSYEQLWKEKNIYEFFLKDKFSKINFLFFKNKKILYITDGNEFNDKKIIEYFDDVIIVIPDFNNVDTNNLMLENLDLIIDNSNNNKIENFNIYFEKLNFEGLYITDGNILLNDVKNVNFYENFTYVIKI